MMTDWTIFGTPDLFEVAARWREDTAPCDKRPRGYGWSMGDLRITVANRCVTHNERDAERHDHVRWYLLPVLEWLARHWASLLHEEDYAWRDNTTLPAAVACPHALERWIAADDPQGQEFYRKAQAWHRRHGLRSAAEGGLFPDLYLRRYLDTIELSWTGGQPQFAGDTFSFISEPGTAYLPITAVAEPLWRLLNWAQGSGPAQSVDEKAGLQTLGARLRALANITNAELEEAYAPARVLKIARSALKGENVDQALRDVRVAAAPALAQFSPAVAMFGGVSPDMGEADVRSLSSYLAKAMGGAESAQLAQLVGDPSFPTSRPPYIEGQQLALDLLEELGWTQGDFIDVRAIASKLGVDIVEVKLQTDTVRGVALAGECMAPTLLINLTSPYNGSEEGRRFSVAHELCHILYDRGHARRVAVSSGPWAPATIEKRANAFAAMLLMPSALVSERLRDGASRADTLSETARSLHVSEAALAEHAYNLGLIGESVRARVRERITR